MKTTNPKPQSPIQTSSLLHSIASDFNYLKILTWIKINFDKIEFEMEEMGFEMLGKKSMLDFFRSTT